jgi:hypothetical protein
MMDRILKNDLYFKQLQRAKKQKAHAAASLSNAATVPKTAASSKSEEQAKPAAAKRGFKRKAEEAHGDDKQALANTAKEDVYEKLFGRVEPRDIPESSAWWRQRAAELLAVSEPHERGMFTGMVTITQNDASPELLANARRGPCAPPNESEMVEYLFTHKRSHQEKRPNITKDATAATLSYQMRAHAMKKSFLHQNRRTPLGHCTDYWDRTEAQRRHALHGHILYWAKRRKFLHQWKERAQKVGHVEVVRNHSRTSRAKITFTKPNMWLESLGNWCVPKRTTKMYGNVIPSCGFSVTHYTNARVHTFLHTGVLFSRVLQLSLSFPMARGTDAAV